MAEDDHLAHIPRWAAGAFGGFVLSLAQALGQQQQRFAEAMSIHDYVQVQSILWGFAFGTVILILIVTVIVCFTAEQNRIKCFWLGVSAPALVLTAIPGAANIAKHALMPITAAYAAERPASCEKPQDKVSIVNGLKMFFGIEEQEKYRVVVGSFKKPEDAAALAAKVNAESLNVKAFVADRAPCNDYYAVVASPYLSISSAIKVQDQVLQLNSVPGAYLSPMRDR